MRSTAIAFMSLVAACNQPLPGTTPRGDAQSAAPSAPSPEPSARPATREEAQVATLAGEWRVAAIDGVAYDESVGLALSGDAGEIWWEPRCAGQIHPYRIDGFSLHTGRSDATPAGSVSAPVPPPVCAIGLPPRLGEVSRAIRSATRIERTEQNGVLLSGGGHSLLLFSQ